MPELPPLRSIEINPRLTLSATRLGISKVFRCKDVSVVGETSLEDLICAMKDKDENCLLEGEHKCERPEVETVVDRNQYDFLVSPSHSV